MKIKIIDKSSSEVLAYYPLERSEQAFNFAKECEEMGLDVRIDTPNIHESLADELGLNADEISKLKESMEEELDSHGHEGSCCFTE